MVTKASLKTEIMQTKTGIIKNVNLKWQSWKKVIRHKKISELSII